MARLTGTICRAGGRVALGLIAVAILLGRTAREPTAVDETRPGPRLPASPRHHAIGGRRFARDRFTPRTLDTRSGRLTPWEVPGLVGADPLGCSPWRDGEGQHHLVVFCRPLARSAADGHRGDFGLTRCTFPRGQVVGRLPLEGLPPAHVSWAPDRSDRILYTAADGRLYSCMFPVGAAGSTPPPRPRPVAWRCEPPGLRGVFLMDPCWPAVPALGGRILIGLGAWDAASQVDRGCRIWWLRLDPGGAEIVTAGLAIEPSAAVPTDRDLERLPVVGTTPDGQSWLAYLARSRGRGNWELWLTTIATDGPDRPPRIPSPGRLLASDGLTITPAFSPDGRWVYGALPDAQDGIRFERFEVAPPAETPLRDPIGD